MRVGFRSSHLSPRVPSLSHFEVWSSAENQTTRPTCVYLLLAALLQLGRSRKCKDILEGWVIEGGDVQPGLLEILKASRTPEVEGLAWHLLVDFGSRSLTARRLSWAYVIGPCPCPCPCPCPEIVLVVVTVLIETASIQLAACLRHCVDRAACLPYMPSDFVELDAFKVRLNSRCPVCTLPDVKFDSLSAFS